MAEQQAPFVDLPAALVEEVLNGTEGVAEELLGIFRLMRAGRDRLRSNLLERGLVMKESALGYPPIPTTCAVDGSYAIDRLLTTDLTACAAVAMEGLTPPSEKRHWQQPHHLTFIRSEIHHPDTATVLRAVMLGSELLLAVRAPHDLVMIDGTLTLPIIYFNQALAKCGEAPELGCSKEFQRTALEFLVAYLDMLRSERSDKHYAGLPKYSTRREVGRLLEWPIHHDDRGTLTMLLDGGELTKPMPLEQPAQPWHLATRSLPAAVRADAEEVAGKIVDTLRRIRVLYYKPHEWLPALRIEVAENVAENHHRLATLVQGIKHQSATPGMLEPYPLYLADRMVKALARAVPAFRQVATQRVSEKYEGNIGEVFFGMHGYRSESGRL
ncbi:MAG: DNA double-strand break repair nuclease NurA [Acidobacteriota bacterium]